MQIPQGGVAFFDSGIGGLTVLAKCKQRLPNEIFYYYGDNERAPYGNLPPDQIERYVFQAFDELQSLKIKAAVIACNTATAVCAEKLRAKYTFPIVGAEPAVFSAAKTDGDVFVLTTRATCNSPRFLSLCTRAQQRNPKARIFPKPCDCLAGEIEKHLFDPAYDFTPLLPQGNPAAVVLGCTHYIYLKKKIEKFYGAPTFDGNEGIAKRLAYFLGENASQTTSNTAPVFFLGNQKNVNKQVFEQTFG